MIHVFFQGTTSFPSVLYWVHFLNRFSPWPLLKAQAAIGIKWYSFVYYISLFNGVILTVSAFTFFTVVLSRLM